jgi:hypothetical protein
MVKTNIQTFTGEVEILSNLHVGPSGSSYLTANGAASNVLDITGNVGATFFVGDGGFLSNIATTLSDIVNQGNVSANVLQFNSTSDYAGVGLVTSSNVGIQNTAPSHTLSIGDKIRVDDNTVETSGQSVIQVDGRILATRFQGDGGLLSNIATTFESIVNQGNVASNVVKFSSDSAYAGAGVITDSNVGIQNTAPTHNLSVGSNLHVNDTGSNVLTVHGNVVASNLNLGVFSIVPAYGLNDVCNTSNGTSNVVQFQNATTSLIANSNIVVSGNVTALQLISTANTEVGDRLKFSGSNVFVDTLRVADVAANIVTYDRTTGELLDSSGTFMNKFAVVSEQPPSDLFANTTTVTNHGGYTLTTSNLATNSNTYNAFDGTANAWVSGDLAGGYIGGANVFLETNLTQLSNLHPTQFGDWLAIEFPYKTTLRHMKLTPLTAAQFPASANIYATNNDITWTEINYWSGRNPVTASNVQTITVNATEQFKKYALVATKAAGNSSNVALQDWQLFTESFSIDGGKVAMAQQAATGGETVMDQHGPHGRGVVPLKKYPESHVTFKWDTMEKNHNTTTGVGSYYIPGGGYKVSASSMNAQSDTNVGGAYGRYAPWQVFDETGWENVAIEAYGWVSNGSKYSSSDGSVGSAATTTYDGSSTATGEWLELELPNKIKLKRFSVVSLTHNSTAGIDGRMPKTVTLLGSNEGSTWSLIDNVSMGATSPGEGIWDNANVDQTEYYKYIRFVVTSTYADGSPAFTDTGFSELRYYGYEEDPPLGDTSVDTTFTSIMNTPQTTGAQVYVDGSLGGNANTNRVVGPAAANTAATYDTTGKYWELNGTLTSNISVEANTFLSGDQPHAVSVWFNSSNLEANVSNTCVFSVSDQEKLDSVNLDLQSNTWHNLTYAYQGEGGSRVTYLDGRKVAEDQAEDTFGAYPPFDMTGYSQGGYVVSASSEHDNGVRLSWKAFESGTGNETGLFMFNESGPKYGPTATTSAALFEGVRGEWIKLELPEKIYINYLFLRGAQGSTQSPEQIRILGSNDDVNWDVVKDTFTVSTPAADSNDAINSTKAYKYIILQVIKVNGGTAVQIKQILYYGHRENDLVRLPDPTNVLKYPHIAMTGYAQRGYVASASGATNPAYDSYHAFNNITANGNGSWHSEGSYATSGSRESTTSTLSSWTGGGGGHNGAWLKIQLPNKIVLNNIIFIPRPVLHQQPRLFSIVGSNDDSNWYLVHEETSRTFTGATAPNPDPHTMSGPYASTAWKYFAVVIRTGSTDNTYNHVAIGDWELYGTGVDSVPIQIGGGNIDKVANFRVYDKFVGEDQALEIWDAQKDEFGRAKSSMTLQKGRLGIGTTEPQGRLAVADEPHNLEEFPPRGIPSTGPINADNSKVYIDGHGTYEVLYSITDPSHFNNATDNPLVLFDKNSNTGVYSQVNTYRLNSAGATGSSVGSGNPLADPAIYTGSNTHGDQTYKSLGGYGGIWYGLKFPYKVNLEESYILPRGGGLTTTPNTAVFLGSEDGGLTWTKIGEFSGASWEQYKYNKYTLSHTKPINAVAIVVTHSNHNYAVNMGEIKFFGTREQGQSVLHDGQLTLTKNLTVPRIGPALDADDTPRRDRLVVEYNTSTNPTFEGAVRDTSGRGNDGILIDGAYYDASEKALDIDTFNSGTSTTAHIRSGIIPGFTGNQRHTISLWFKTGTDFSGTWAAVAPNGGESTANQVSSISYETSTTRFKLESWSNDIATGSYPLQSGTWYHVVVTYEGATVTTSTKKFYVNGTAVTTSDISSGSAINFTDPVVILGERIHPSNEVNGQVSNFKLYDTALTASEVKTLYDMGRCDEGHHMVNFSKTRVGIGLGDGEAPRAALDVRDVASFDGDVSIGGSYSGGIRPSATLHIAGTVQNGENSTPTSNQGTTSRLKPSTRIWMANNLSDIDYRGDYWGCAMGVFYDGRTYFQSLNKNSTAMYEILLNPVGGNARVGGSLISTSDDRIKTNEEYIENATETLLKLKPQTYDKQPDMNTKDGWKMKESGLIAQDVWYDTPELRHLVSYDKNAKIQLEKPIVDGDPQNDPDYSLWGEVAGLNYEGLIAYLVKSNQEIYNELQNTKIQLTTSLASQNITPFQGDSIKLWITNENGSLQVGDSVMTSNISGYFTKGEPTFANVSSACEFTTSRIQTYYSNIVSVTESNVITTSETPQEGYTENAYYSSNTISYYTGNVISHYSNVMIYDGVNVYTNVNVGEYANLTANSQSNYLAITESNTSSIEIEGYTPVLSYSNISSDEYDSNLHTDYIKVISHYSNVTVIENVEYSNIDVATYSNLETNVLITPRYTYFSNVITSEESNVVSHSNIRVQEYATLTPTKRSNYTVHTVDEVRSNLQTHYTPHTITIPNELRYLDGSGTLTDQANATYIATQVNCVL